MSNYNSQISIKQWAEADRPREKLLHKGKQNLSNAELLAIILCSGNHKETALDLAKKILAQNNENLFELSKLGVHDLTRIKGIGKVKAITLLAALELANRKSSWKALSRDSVFNSKDVFNVMNTILNSSSYEEFWIILLNRANKIIHKTSISEGGISGTVADPRKIYKIALDYKACSMILCHNHPSGNVKPSEADIKLTQKLKNAGKLIDIYVIDHVIIGEGNFFSFADEGRL